MHCTGGGGGGIASSGHAGVEGFFPGTCGAYSREYGMRNAGTPPPLTPPPRFPNKTFSFWRCPQRSRWRFGATTSFSAC